MEQRFGIKTLFFYLYQRVTLGIVLLLLSVNLPGISQFIISMGNVTPSPTMTDTINRIGNFAMVMAVLFSLFVIILGIVLSWIKYISSTFTIGEYGITLRHGFIGKIEILIPYKQIQSVDTNQSIFFRILGLSHLVIMSAGKDEFNKTGGEEIFNIIDSKIGEHVKGELLKRADVINVVNVTK